MIRARIGIWSKLLSKKSVDNPYFKFDLRRYYVVEMEMKNGGHGAYFDGDVKAIEMFFPDGAEPAEMRCELLRARAVYLASVARKASIDCDQFEREALSLGYKISDKGKMRIARRTIREKSRGFWKGTKHEKKQG